MDNEDFQQMRTEYVCLIVNYIYTLLIDDAKYTPCLQLRYQR